MISYSTISGGIYSGEPQKLKVIYSYERPSLDKPKSVSFKCPYKSIKMFSG